jgi:ribosome-associated protein
MAKKKTASKGKTIAKAKKATSKSKPTSKKAPAKSKAPAKKAAKTARPAAKTAAKTTKAKSVAVKAKTAKPKAAAPKPKDEGWMLAESVVRGILEKKGQNVRWLDLRKIENAVCDYFIICEGTSNIQVEAIADSVETTVKDETNQRPYRSEGWENALWILIDYVNVVVHVFDRDTRDFYKLEQLWADAEEIPVKQ